MSDSARPDIEAFGELEQLIRALGDEMAAWRRRAHEAEARLKEAEARLAGQAGTTRPANGALERENEELRQRLGAARLRTKQLMDRVRFLRQQHETDGAGGTER